MSIGALRSKTPTLDEWLNQLREIPEVGELLSRADRREGGYLHTLREIAQQPVTWLETAHAMVAEMPAFASLLSEPAASRGPLLLTGSGSSHCIAQSLAPSLQTAFRRPALAIPAGDVLTDPEAILASQPGLVISFARSGDSPESSALVDHCLAARPGTQHLIFTCNARGTLATRYKKEPRVTCVVLDEKTNDKSLVMTSSFTNLFVAGHALTRLEDPAGYEQRVARLSRAAERILTRCDSLSLLSRRDFRSAIFLASSARIGGARESALKMLEMSSGHVMTMSETYLGLRHGPMSAVHPSTLIVCFLASDPVVRGYETDLLRELTQKKLGLGKVIVGSQIPAALVSPQDVAVDIGAPSVEDRDFPVLDVVVGQLLAFFECRSLGLRPDAPSPDNVIRRVVEGFPMHGQPHPGVS